MNSNSSKAGKSESHAFRDWVLIDKKPFGLKAPQTIAEPVSIPKTRRAPNHLPWVAVSIAAGITKYPLRKFHLRRWLRRVLTLLYN